MYADPDKMKKIWIDGDDDTTVTGNCDKSDNCKGAQLNKLVRETCEFFVESKCRQFKDWVIPVNLNYLRGLDLYFILYYNPSKWASNRLVNPSMKFVLYQVLFYLKVHSGHENPIVNTKSPVVLTASHWAYPGYLQSSTDCIRLP